MDTRTDARRPIRVAVVGAGPAGFYTAAALVERLPDGVAVDMLERLLAPYGLVRYGVAPDHPKIKSVVRVYERVASNPAVRFIGNVTVGRDVTAAELHRFYDIVVYAIGAQTDRLLGIPGEELAGCLTSTAFVSWYNGHPFYADFGLDLDHEIVAVVGAGNVAIDVARILARSADELATTDIDNRALGGLRRSRVRDVHVLVRRGPVHARCTPGELRELGAIDGVDVVVDPGDLTVDPADEAELVRERDAARNLDILRAFASAPRRGTRRVRFRFYTSPVEVLGIGGRVSGLRLARTTIRRERDGAGIAVPTGATETLDASLVITAIGYRSVPIDGVSFDDAAGLVPNVNGRVIDPATGRIEPRTYVVGWAKRGPRGLIGSNKADAAETVACIADDLPDIRGSLDERRDLPDIMEHLSTRGVRATTFDEWQLLDRLEIARGRSEGRPRVKFVRTEEMIERLETPDDDDP